MKRGTTPTLKIKIGIDDVTTISQIEFILKQECKEECTTYVTKTYPSASVTYDSTNKLFLVSYTENETRIFSHDTTIWLDTKITLTNGKIPATEIVKLYMNNTLFTAQAVNSND